jgi:pimeloyl-ACP methyl ester carboxylesterase
MQMHAEVAGAAREEVRSVWNDELEIHVQVGGSGPPLFFLHAAGGLRWTPFLDRLAEDYTVYAPQLPGTHPSDPHAIHKVDNFADLLLMYEELVRALGIAGAPVIGESFGGMMAADLAAHFPELFSKLVLLAPAGLWLDDHPPTVFELTAAKPEEVPGYLFANPDSDIAKAFFAMPDDPELIPGIVASLVWAQGCSGKFLWPIPDQGAAKRLHRVSAPTLILFGSEDRVMPAVYGEEYARLIPGSRLEIFDGCGHIPQVEELERTLELVSSFLHD